MKQKKIDSNLLNILKMIDEKETNNDNLREWLKKLIFEIPNDMIKNETKGYLEDLTLYEISLKELLLQSHQLLMVKWVLLFQLKKQL